MSKWNELCKLWEEYFRYYVIGNDDMIKPSLHCFLGIVLKTQYLSSGHYNSSRFHTFFIRQSGTGKGQITKCIYFLCKKFPETTAFMTIKVTDAALIGTLDKNNKGNVVTTEGLLAKYDLIAWDEGDVLLKKGSFNDNLADIIQMAADEPGYISKALRYGTIGFKTDTTFLTGSISTLNINDAILKRGTLQRFYINFKTYSSDEIYNIQKNITSLINKEKSDKDEISQRIITFINGIKVAKYLKINGQACEKINEKILAYFKKNILKQYNDEKQEVLYSFFNRARNIIYKVATHYATIEGKDEIDLESLEVGLDVFYDHLNSVTALLDSIGKTHVKANDTRYTIVKNIIKKLGKNANRNNILVELRKLKEANRWDFGYNKSLELLEQMEQNSIVNSNCIPGDDGGHHKLFSVP